MYIINIISGPNLHDSIPTVELVCNGHHDNIIIILANLQPSRRAVPKVMMVPSGVEMAGSLL